MSTRYGVDEVGALAINVSHALEGFFVNLRFYVARAI